jgi:hypothetical protein
MDMAGSGSIPAILVAIERICFQIGTVLYGGNGTIIKGVV